MPCNAPKCIEERKRKEAIDKEMASNSNGSDNISNACSIAKTYVTNVVTKQAQYYRNNKKFGSQSQINLKSAPNSKHYSYGFIVIGTNYVAFRATPLVNGLPVIMGYAYIVSSGSAYTIHTLVQVSKKLTNSNLITKDEPQKRQLSLENGWSYNCI